MDCNEFDEFVVAEGNAAVLVNMVTGLPGKVVRGSHFRIPFLYSQMEYDLKPRPRMVETNIETKGEWFMDLEDEVLIGCPGRWRKGNCSS